MPNMEGGNFGNNGLSGSSTIKLPSSMQGGMGKFAVIDLLG